MPYRQTANVARKLAARQRAILTAAREAAAAGMAAVQMAPVAERAGVAAGTIYRYFPSKTELVAALVTELAGQEIEALRRAAATGPGPLSALTAAITTFAARALSQRRLAFALLAEPVEPEINAARAGYREALAREFETLIAAAVAGGQLPAQEPSVSAPALVGALTEGLVGSLAPASTDDPAIARTQMQALTLFSLRGLGVADARARGLVLQASIPEPATG